jgi:hypothetical protein
MIAAANGCGQGAGLGDDDRRRRLKHSISEWLWGNLPQQFALMWDHPLCREPATLGALVQAFDDR